MDSAESAITAKQQAELKQKPNTTVVDYSAICDERLPALATTDSVDEALQALMELEKQTRLGADYVSCIRVIECLVGVCVRLGAVTQLCEHVHTLCRHHRYRGATLAATCPASAGAQCSSLVAGSQSLRVFIALVECVCSSLERVTAADDQIRVIDTVRVVCEGKICVEVVRARATLRLARIHERAGRVKEAAAVIQELHVETYGTMERAEKVVFILEQVRLCMLCEDYTRAQIIAKKINVRFFEEQVGAKGDGAAAPTSSEDQRMEQESAGTAAAAAVSEESVGDIRLRYYRLMIDLQLHTDCDYMQVHGHYMNIYRTRTLDPEAQTAALCHALFYLLLAPAAVPEHKDLCLRLLQERPLATSLPRERQLLHVFALSGELISWQWLVSHYRDTLCSSAHAPAVFQYQDPPQLETGEDVEMRVDRAALTAAGRRWLQLRAQVIDHNICVLARSYSRLRLQRMAELLDLGCEEAEQCLARLVVDKTVQARVDRLVGVVVFSPRRSPAQTLADWSANVSALMTLINRTSHLINKEEMVHKHLLAVKSE